MSNTATKYTEKYNKSKATVKDEFFISSQDVVVVSQYKEKIEDMYEIKLILEEKSESGQWLLLEGESGDRRNAKNYIAAICNPSEKKQVQFPTSSCSELTDPATLENIEKQTNAFIRPLMKIAQFEISGTELAVTLALSKIEELVGSAVEGEEQFEDSEDVIDGQSEGVIKISPATHTCASRLNSVLERALSSYSDGVCSVEDYQKVKPSVQRVLVNCLQNEDDIDDDMLFADGNIKGNEGNINVYCEDIEKTKGKFDGETQSASKLQKSPGDGAFAEKLTELKISKPETLSPDTKTSQPSALLTKQQTYLRSLGLSVGYKEHQVDEAIKMVNEKTRPSDFLDFLASVPEDDDQCTIQSPVASNASSDDVVILSTETVDLVSGVTTVEHRTDDKDTSNHVYKADTSSKSKLPDGYTERLMRDFQTEDENCSIEELKRRNAERQKLLKENFEKQKQQQMQEAGQKKGKGKNRGKKNKQQKQKNTENDKDRTERHEKQFRLDSGESGSRTYSSDVEQTCVLKVWNIEQGLGQNTSPVQEVQTTPKRKNCKGRNTHQYQAPPQQQQPGILGDFNPQQHSANSSGLFNKQGSEVRERQWHQGQSTYSGAASKGLYPKPTQIVTPVYPPQKEAPTPGMSVVQTTPLRYIVIDGSNVAMTHGNGKYFSCKGIKLCVDYFRQRGHKEITVFVPNWRRCRASDENPILDQNLLLELKEEGILVFTPSRRIGGKLVVSYDDRYVLELAEEEDAVIVSNDQYRDLMMEKTAWRKIIEERLLLYSFVKDRFMPPNDPLGRDGPCLDVFLQKTKKTYNVRASRWQYHNQQQHQHYHQPQGHGHFIQNQAQYNHGNFNQGPGHYAKAASGGINKQDIPPLMGGNKYQLLDQQFDEMDSSPTRSPQVKGHWKHNQRGQGQGQTRSKGIARTDEETENLFQELRALFPEEDQEEKIRTILTNHQTEKDLMKLTNYCMSILFDT